MTSATDLRVRDILRQVTELAVEYKQLTGKPLGVTGEIAEYLAAEKFGLQLAGARTKGYDAIRWRNGREERIQIKGRVIPEINSRSQRVGTIKKDAPCDTVLLVLMHPKTMAPLEFWEAGMDAVRQRLEVPGSKARSRGSLGVHEFKRLASLVWSSGDAGE